MSWTSLTREHVLTNCSSRLRNLAAQVATSYEDDGEAVIAEEMVELATIIQLVVISLRRGDVHTVQGDDYVPSQGNADIPF